jgi:hypothetical protein
VDLFRIAATKEMHYIAQTDVLRPSGRSFSPALGFPISVRVLLVLFFLFDSDKVRGYINDISTEETVLITQSGLHVIRETENTPVTQQDADGWDTEKACPTAKLSDLRFGIRPGETQVSL